LDEKQMKTLGKPTFLMKTNQNLRKTNILNGKPIKTLGKPIF